MLQWHELGVGTPFHYEISTDSIVMLVSHYFISEFNRNSLFLEWFPNFASGSTIFHMTLPYIIDSIVPLMIKYTHKVALDPICVQIYEEKELHNVKVDDDGIHFYLLLSLPQPFKIIRMIWIMASQRVFTIDLIINNAQPGINAFILYQ